MLVVGGLTMATNFLIDKFGGHKIDADTVKNLQNEVKTVHEEIKNEGLMINKLNQNFV